MMKRTGKRRRFLTWSALLLMGATFQLGGLVEGCNDRLIGLTGIIDPCGTFLANCNPGDFQARNSNLGDPCVDPTCTVAGQCAGPGNLQPLGTLYSLCD